MATFYQLASPYVVTHIDLSLPSLLYALDQQKAKKLLERDWVNRWIFFKAYKIKSVLSLHAQMVFKFLACLVQEKMIYLKFLFVSLKTLTKSKIVPEAASYFLYRLSLVDFLRCPVLGSLRYDISVHRWVPVSFFMIKIAASEHLKRVIGRIFAISKCFHRSKLKLSFWFSSQKDS